MARSPDALNLARKLHLSDSSLVLYWPGGAAGARFEISLKAIEISEIIGEDTRGLCIYRALRPLYCHDCGEEIGAGKLFSRWPLAEGGLRILPRCRKCVPLSVAEERTQAGSELVDSLLRSPDTQAQSSPEREKRIDEELNKRLGPALSRTRRTRFR